MSQEDNQDNNNKNEKIYLLTNILCRNPNENNSYLPLISSPNDINIFFKFFIYNDYTEENYTAINHIKLLNTKIEILNSLMNLFKLNDNLMYIFIKKCKSNIKSFFDPLIDIYLDE